MIGYDASRSQSHTYALPGLYIITITASNDGGTASVEKTVTVLG